MTQDQEQKIINLLDKNEFGVIATNCSGRAPESAVVAVSNTTSDLQIIFGTFKASRKYANILTDNKVSLAVGWDNQTKQTMQIEGLATEVSPEQRGEIEDIHCKKNPSSERFRGNLQQSYFLIKPTWIRYSDYSVSPQEVWEVEV